MSKCPVCKKLTVEEYTPFCSKRCADVDLGRWLSDSYVVEGDENSAVISDEEAET